ncbi:MAG TPA: peroxidase [Acidobacteria bacterium]|nr:peroxidase [Acidobacteriota bacterium]
MDLRAEAPADKVETLVSADPSAALDDAQRALLDYARKLTLTPASCCREDIDALRAAGADDTMIHAAVQVAAYFNYINRVADGLGVEPESE